MSKERLRKQMKAWRKQLLPPDRQEMSKRVVQRLLVHPDYQTSSTVLFYLATQGEISLYRAMELAWDNGKNVIVPCVHGTELAGYVIDHPSQLKIGSYGILEPDIRKANKVHSWEIELALIPGVAFDRNGYRLGYGRGYYDRYFAGQSKTKQMGIAYSEQVVHTVYPEKHDLQVDHILTPDFVWDITEQSRE